MSTLRMERKTSLYESLKQKGEKARERRRRRRRERRRRGGG